MISYPQRVFIEVWGLSFHHFNSHNTERPNIYFGAISFPCDHFRCHPVWSPNHGAALALLWGDLSTETKVGCKTIKKKLAQVSASISTANPISRVSLVFRETFHFQKNTTFAPMPLTCKVIPALSTLQQEIQLQMGVNIYPMQNDLYTSVDSSKIKGLHLYLFIFGRGSCCFF